VLNQCLSQKPSRRRILTSILAASAVPHPAGLCFAQSYPTRSPRIIVGFAPGGGNDIVARLTGQWLTERLGQSFVIENRPGGGSNTATEAVVRAPADGYTLLLVSLANATNATLYDKLTFNFLQDIAPVAGIVRVPNVMLVHPAMPVNSVSEFIAYAKTNPGKVNMASGGTGGPVHMIGALFNVMSGLKMQHVPYRGEALALSDLMAGQAQVVFGSLPASIEHIRAGTLRALAVTTAIRAEALPHVPAVGDFVRGYDASTWYGIGAPKNTRTEIIELINTEINGGLNGGALRARLNEFGGMPIGGTPADFRRLIAEDTEKWGMVIRATKMKPE